MSGSTNTLDLVTHTTHDTVNTQVLGILLKQVGWVGGEEGLTSNAKLQGME